MWCNIAPHAFFGGRPMARQSISFTPPNDEWLKAQVDSEEYGSKSEVVNDLIRRAREKEFIRVKLERAEQGGFTNSTPAEILAKSKEELQRNGKL
jgi:antitoxin ParD1/3/4